MVSAPELNSNKNQTHRGRLHQAYPQTTLPRSSARGSMIWRHVKPTGPCQPVRWGIAMQMTNRNRTCDEPKGNRAWNTLQPPRRQCPTQLRNRPAVKTKETGQQPSTIANNGQPSVEARCRPPCAYKPEEDGGSCVICRRKKEPAQALPRNSPA